MSTPKTFISKCEEGFDIYFEIKLTNRRIDVFPFDTKRRGIYYQEREEDDFDDPELVFDELGPETISKLSCDHREGKITFALGHTR